METENVCFTCQFDETCDRAPFFKAEDGCDGWESREPKIIEQELRFTDPDFLPRFQQQCKENPIGSTEMMLYHGLKAILNQITPMTEITASSCSTEVDWDAPTPEDVIDGCLPKTSTGAPMPNVKPPKEPEPLKPVLITDALNKNDTAKN